MKQAVKIFLRECRRNFFELLSKILLFAKYIDCFQQDTYKITYVSHQPQKL